MKIMQYYVVCIALLSLCPHINHAQQEKTTTIEDKIIAQGSRIKLWKLLIQRIITHEKFLTSKNITRQDTKVWETFYLETEPLFDEELKRLVLDLINNSTMLPSLQEVSKNRISSFDINLILGLTIQKNGLKEASIDGIAVKEEAQTLEAFLLNKALPPAKEANDQPPHENPEQEEAQPEFIEPIQENEAMDEEAPSYDLIHDDQEPAKTQSPEKVSQEEEPEEDLELIIEQNTPQTPFQDITPSSPTTSKANTPSTQETKAFDLKGIFLPYGITALALLLFLLLGMLFFVRRKKK